MHQLARNGNRRRASGEQLRSDREALIGTLLIGNNAVNVLASALATSAAIALFGDGGVFVATLAMTVILVLLAEVLPKSYHPQQCQSLCAAYCTAGADMFLALAAAVCGGALAGGQAAGPRLS